MRPWRLIADLTRSIDDARRAMSGERPLQKVPSDLSQLATILAATFLLGSTFPAGKLLLQHHNPPFLLAGLRFLAAPISIGLMAALLGAGVRATFLPSLNRRGWATMAAIGLLQTSLCIGCLFLAMQRISPSAAALLLFTNPIWVAALGIFVLGQPLTRNRIAGLFLGIVGVCFILAPAAGNFDAAGYAFGLLSSFGWAGATLLTKRAGLPVSSWTLTLWQMLSGSVALFCLSLVAGENWTLAFQTGGDLPVFAWLAIPGSAGAYGLWSIALRRTRDAGEVSAFLFLVPLFATVLSYCLLGSTLTAPQLVGGTAICSGLWLSARLSPVPRNLFATR
jgi:drug/metabolite transporter (DMT)-like permease